MCKNEYNAIKRQNEEMAKLNEILKKENEEIKKENEELKIRIKEIGGVSIPEYRTSEGINDEYNQKDSGDSDKVYQSHVQGGH